jgi:FAD:protein FMN transferase
MLRPLLGRRPATLHPKPRPPGDGGMRSWVEHIMGTAISIATWSQEGPEQSARSARGLVDAFAELRRADELFSPFKPSSQISLLRQGATSLERCDPEVREVLALCEQLRHVTGGYFDAYAAGPDQLDPCGLVKGWAAQRASDVLVEAGVPTHYVSAGGDVCLRGQPHGDRLWRVGIADPYRPGELLATIHSSNLAVATSGVAERGAHVLDPHPRRPSDRAGQRHRDRAKPHAGRRLCHRRGRHGRSGARLAGRPGRLRSAAGRRQRRGSLDPRVPVTWRRV